MISESLSPNNAWEVLGCIADGLTARVESVLLNLYSWIFSSISPTALVSGSNLSRHTACQDVNAVKEHRRANNLQVTRFNTLFLQGEDIRKRMYFWKRSYNKLFIVQFARFMSHRCPMTRLSFTYQGRHTSAQLDDGEGGELIAGGENDLVMVISRFDPLIIPFHLSFLPRRLVGRSVLPLSCPSLVIRYFNNGSFREMRWKCGFCI